MMKTIFREVGSSSVRRSPRPKRITTTRRATSSSFDSLLTKLGLASSQLQRARKRR